MSVVVLGGLNMDLVALAARLPRPGETLMGAAFLQAPGGKGANQAVAARRMGAAVRFLGCVGRDAFGTSLLDSLTSEGVDITAVRVVAGDPTGCAIILSASGGENEIVVVPGANQRVDAPELRALGPALEGARVLMLQLEVPLHVTLHAAQYAHERGITVLLDPAPARSLSRELLACCTLLTPNALEAGQLTGRAVRTPRDARDAARQLVSAGAQHCIVKVDAQGGGYCLGNETGTYDAIPVDAVDTVAAGDAFAGALAAGIATGLTIRQALDWARAAGALAVTRRGAQPSLPTRAEVLGLLQRHPSGLRGDSR